MTTKHEEHIQMIEDCEKREEKLTDWERTFIDSMRRRVDEDRALTNGQSIALNEIWDRIT